MEQITWLHVSDLHRGQAGERGRWPSARDAVLNDIRQMAQQLGPPDLLIFTGDLAFSGHPAEYLLVEETIQDLSRAAGGNPLVVSVPGNHDLRRPDPGQPQAAGFEDYLKKPRLRRRLVEGQPDTIGYLDSLFSGYKEWWNRTVVQQWARRSDVTYKLGLLPGDFSLTLDRPGLRLGIIGANSAFLQQASDPPGVEDYYKGRLVIETEQIPEDLPRWASEHDTALLLMHHPPDWLANPRLFERDIYHPEWFAACLFGHLHEHRLRSESGRRWLQGGSLFGLEFWGEGRHERQELGYGWGRIQRTAPALGRLERWPRRGELSENNTWVLGQPPGALLQEEIALPRRTPRSGVKALVVAVSDELGSHRHAVAERLRRIPQIGEVKEAQAEKDDQTGLIDHAELLVVLLGGRTGGTDVLARALERSRDPIVLRPDLMRRPRGVTAAELTNAQYLNQLAEALYAPRPVPEFEFKGEIGVVASVQAAVAEWLDRRAPQGAAERVSLYPFERDYLQHLSAIWSQGNHGPLLQVAKTADRSLDRTKLYVSLRAEPDLIYATGQGRLILQTATGAEVDLSAERRLAYLEQAVSHPQMPHVVVEGEAGSGKTVLLQHIALVLAQVHLGEPLAPHRLNLDALSSGRPLSPVPLLFEARQLAGHLPQVAGVQDLISAMQHELERVAGRVIDPDILSTGLRAGRYLLLIDSLDEVTESDSRLALVRCLEGISSLGDWRSRTVLTTRPSAYTGNGSYGGMLRKLRIARLLPEDAEAIAQRYCAAFAHSAAYQKQMLAAIAEVRARHGGANLAENPLMLAVTMIVYEAQRRLPDSTAELYRRIVDILCQTRSIRDLSYEIRRQALALVFDGAQRAGAIEWSVDSAAALLQERMTGSFPSVDHAKAKLDELATSTGLMRFEKRQDGHSRPSVMLRAWHRSFQEYLCACHIAGSSESVAAATDQLFVTQKSGVRIVENPSWEGVLRFLVGVYGSQNTGRARAYVERLYDYAAGNANAVTPTRHGRILGLVATGLAEYKEHFGGGNHPLIGRVRQEVVNSFEANGATWPVEDRRLALVAVGQLGDPRLDRDLWILVENGVYSSPKTSEQVPPFQIAFRPIAVADYRGFVDAGGYQNPRFWAEHGVPQEYDAPLLWERQCHHPNHPVTGVSFYEAQAYCRWATATLPLPAGHFIDLPTTKEWLVATEAAGNSEEQQVSERVGIRPIGMEPPSRGIAGKLMDMRGHVTQWCTDIVNKPPANGCRVLLGFNHPERAIILSLPQHREPVFSFRVVCRVIK